jgi:hypothetical protein
LDENKKPLVCGQKQKTGTVSRKRAQKTEDAASSKKKKAKISSVPAWASSKQSKVATTHAPPTPKTNGKKPHKWLIGECRHFEHKEEMEKFGNAVIDVGAIGNCCPYTSMLGLEKIGRIEPGSKTATEFRRELREFASTNQEQFINDNIPKCQKEGIGKEFCWEKTVLDPLFLLRLGMSYENGCGVSGWFRGEWHFPLIAMKHKISIVVCASNSNMRDGVKEPILSKWTNVYHANGEQDWITRRLAHPCTLPIDIKATIFIVYNGGDHCLHLSVPEDIEGPEDDELMMEEPPED